jgi:hypothetical protein
VFALDKAREIVDQFPSRFDTVRIYTDSTSSLRIADRCWDSSIGMYMRRNSRRLHARGVKNVEMHWTPGHSSVPGNELADKIANIAAEFRDTQLSGGVDLGVENETILSEVEDDDDDDDDDDRAGGVEDDGNEDEGWGDEGLEDEGLDDGWLDDGWGKIEGLEDEGVEDEEDEGSGVDDDEGDDELKVIEVIDLTGDD